MQRLFHDVEASLLPRWSVYCMDNWDILIELALDCKGKQWISVPLTHRRGRAAVAGLYATQSGGVRVEVIKNICLGGGFLKS